MNLKKKDKFTPEHAATKICKNYFLLQGHLRNSSSTGGAGGRMRGVGRGGGKG